MGLPPSELENITPYEFNLLREGYFKKEVAKERRTRTIAWMIYATAPKAEEDEEAKEMTMHNFYPLPGDPVIIPKGQGKEARRIDPEEKARLEAMMNAIK